MRDSKIEQQAFSIYLKEQTQRVREREREREYCFLLPSSSYTSSQITTPITYKTENEFKKNQDTERERERAPNCEKDRNAKLRAYGRKKIQRAMK